MMDISVRMEDKLEEMKALVRVKGPIPAPHVYKTDSGIIVAIRNTTVEVGQDKLGTVGEHGEPGWIKQN